MELFNHLALGFSVALTPINVMYALIGSLLGTLIGVLPGIGPVATIAMLLPTTYALQPVSALIMLAGIYYGAQYGGSTTSILINMPGETASAVTCLDGHQMARNGEAGAALATAALASFFAGCVATVFIAAVSIPLSELALKFGPAEYFSLMVLGLIGAVVLAHGSLLKAIAMILLGLLLGIVGTDVNSGVARFDFGIPELTDGIGIVAVAMGLFGFAEIITNLESQEKRERLKSKVKGLWLSKAQFQAAWPAVLRGTGLGSFLGLLPGGGAMLASFASYAIEKKVAKDPSQFGKGAIQGVAGPEAANNAGAQTSFIPLLTLGIPENAVMAMMVGAMTIHNIQPGPQVMTSNPGLFWGLDSVDVGRQPDAGRAQPAHDRHLDQAADGALPTALPGHPAVLRDRRVLDQQHELRRHADRRLRLPWRAFPQARVRAGAAAAGLRARTDDGGKPAPRHAAVAWRSHRLRHPPAVRGDARRRRPARHRHRAAQHPAQARGSVPGGVMPYDWSNAYGSRRQPVFARNAVATSQPLATQAGIAMLARGGNAVDAALATAITLTVVEPCSNGMGSDLFAILWTGSELVGLNASGRAPAAWSPKRFAGRTAMPERGWEAVTIPGAVSGWAALSKRHGRLPFADLFEPAIRYARDGWQVSPVVAEKWAAAVPALPKDLGWPDAFMPHGRTPRVGERFSCAAMADSLEEIAATHGESFYRGRLAAAMVAHSQSAGGAHTLADFAAQQADWVTPLAQEYRGCTVHEIPPNGQGVSALMALAMLGHVDLRRHAADSVAAQHLQVEAMKLAFADAYRYVGDPRTMPFQWRRAARPRLHCSARAAHRSGSCARFRTGRASARRHRVPVRRRRRTA